MNIHRHFSIYLLCVSVVLSFALTLEAFAQDPTVSPSPLPTPPPTTAAPISITYSGKGSANFQEVFSETAGGSCPIRTNTSNENDTDLTWKAVWKLKPVAGYRYYPKKSSFAGKHSRTDTDDCGGQPVLCSSQLQYQPGSLPVMRVEKSGKSGFVLVISAEDSLDGKDPTSTTCSNSSVFDNAITEGMNDKNVTEMRIKLTPATTSTKQTFKFTNKKTFDCADPAKTLYFISNACTLTMNLSGTVVVDGKWTGKVLK